MKKLQKALVLSGLFVVFSAQAAIASVSLVGVGNYGMPSLNLNGSSSATFSSTLGYGGGILFDIAANPTFSFELGGLYYQQKNTTDSSSLGQPPGTSISTSMWVLEIPVTIKAHLGHVFYVKAGGYLTNVAGSVTQNIGAVAANGNIGDLSQNALNYGVLGGLGFNIPLGQAAALLLEGNYHLQLSNGFNSTVTSASATNSVKYNEAQVLAGVTFGMHGSR